MYAFLGNELIQFTCDDEQAEQQLGLLFSDWPGSYEEPSSLEQRAPDGRSLSMAIRAVDGLEPLPEQVKQIFTDLKSQTTVFQGEQSWYICFGPDAVARIPMALGDELDGPVALQVRRSSLFAARLEDFVFSSLAPLLRRRGLIMIHAFAVERDGGALLLVGESGSGKTTTGLTLTTRGWRYLANDVVLLCEEEGSILALPTPGGVGLDARSLELLPDLGLTSAGAGNSARKRYYSATELVSGWGSQTPASTILFTQLGAEAETALTPTTRAVTLAHLMEASVDRWDTTGLGEHLRLLKLLSHQAAGFDLRLGRELQRLPELLRRAP